MKRKEQNRNREEENNEDMHEVNYGLDDEEAEEFLEDKYPQHNHEGELVKNY